MSEYHHGNLKELLLDEGLKLLNEEGYAGFSLRKLARRCGVSHNSPYRHFRDKDDLIRTISRRIHESFDRALKEALESAGNSDRERLTAMGRGYVRFFLRHPDYLDLLFLSPELQELSPGEHEHCDEAPFSTYLSAVRPLVKGSALPPGNLPAEPGEQPLHGAFLQPWCLIHGLTVLLVKKALPAGSPEELDALIDQVLEYPNENH